MHTPPPPPELMARLPGLAPLGRTATRLHPRPATVSAFESHVGGPVRWPADEPWPTCDAPCEGVEELPLPADLGARWLATTTDLRLHGRLSEESKKVTLEIGRLYPGCSIDSRMGAPPVARRTVASRHPRPNPMAVLAQLRTDDVPDLPRPGGADLLQILWCPCSHMADALPTVQLRWRREADLPEVPAQPPLGEPARDVWALRPCRLHPEQINEYPHPSELPGELQRLVEGWDDDLDYTGVFMASGWKVGGYTDWRRSGEGQASCLGCAGPTELILATDPLEYDFAGSKRWQPVEDRHIDLYHPDLAQSQEPTGLSAYGSSFRIYACLSCGDLPVQLDLQ